MKAIKRTVAALLATLMLATSTSFTLAAENYSANEEVVVAKVNAAGIMTGTDKGFEPSKSLTRAEAAAIIVRMKGISESAVKAMAGTTLFNDVAASHWASGYVNEASQLGIVKGVSATEFAPDREVTVAEFVTMAVRALGAGTMVDTQGTWPVNYVNFANEEGLLDDVTAIYSAVATRMNAATIVANTLTAPMWVKDKVTTNNEVTWSKHEEKSILKDTLKISAVDGSYKYVDDKGTDDKNDDEIITTGKCESVSNKDHLFNEMDVVESLDLSNIKVGLIYDYWKNEDNEIIGLWETEKKDLVKVNFTEITKVTDDKVTLMVDGKEKEYKINSLTISANDSPETLVAGEKYPGVFGVAYVSASKIDSIYAEYYTTYAMVDEVKAKKISFTSKAKAITDGTDAALPSITIDEDKYDYFITKDGKEIKPSDLEKNDALALYATYNSQNKIVKYVGKVLDVEVTGKVTAKSESKNTIKIDGKTYTVDGDSDYFDSIKLDSEIEAYVGENGKIAMFKVVEDAAGEVAIVKSVRKITDKYGADNLEVVLFLEDGTTTDALTLDADEIYDEFKLDENDTYKKDSSDEDKDTKIECVIAFLADSTTTILEDGVAGNGLVYSINGTKLTVKDLDENKPEISDISGETLVIKSKAAYIGAVEVDENTKFFRLKTDKAYSVKVEEIAFDTLDNSKFGDGSFAADLKYKDGAVEYAGMVVFSADAATDVNRTADVNFAFVTDFQQGTKERTIDVISLDGKKPASYTVKDDADAYDDLNQNMIGHIFDLKVVDGKLVEVSDLNKDALTGDEQTVEYGVVYTADNFNPTKTTAKYATKYNSSKTVITLNDNKSYILGDNLLVLEYDADEDEYTVGSIDEIGTYKDATIDAEKSVEYVVNVITYTSDFTSPTDNDEEAVVVIYMIKNN